MPSDNLVSMSLTRVNEVTPVLAKPPERESMDVDALFPATQIHSVLIIDTKGKNLVERNYSFDSDSEANLSLFGGFVAAIAQLCEDIAQDEVKSIQLGTAQFVVLRSNRLLFTLHLGFGASSFATMAKLQRIRDTLVEKYGGDLHNLLTTPPFPPALLTEIDTIVFEQTAIDLEQIIDYFLTGENIVGAELRDLSTGKILFTHSTPKKEQMIEHNSILFELFFELMAAQGTFSFNTNDFRRCLLFKIGGQWLCGIQDQDILLVSVFDEKVDQRVILDIVYGKLEQMLPFVAQYFQEKV